MKLNITLIALILFIGAELFAQRAENVRVRPDTADTATEIPIRVRNDGRTDFFGSGNFTIDARGTLRVSDATRITIEDARRDLQKTRLADGWIYRNLDNEFIVSGSDIRFRFDGDIRSMRGEGTGTLMMRGVGGYSLPARSGTVTEKGVTIELGTPGEAGRKSRVFEGANFRRSSPAADGSEDIELRFENLPNAEFYSSPGDQERQSIRANLYGVLQLFGSGTYSGRVRGTILVDPNSRVRIRTKTRSLLKYRTGEGWMYKNVDSDVSISGGNIRLMTEGEIRNFGGSGSGTLQLKGNGSYTAPGRSGRIPNRGIVIEFGQTPVED